MKTIEGLLTTQGERFCIILARFNDFIGGKLLEGAIDELQRHGVDNEDIDSVRVPGAFEIPVVAKKCAKSGNYAAIITLGAVIKGSTSHYDYVCAEVSKGVASVSLETEVPVIFGVLTTDNIFFTEQLYDSDESVHLNWYSICSGQVKHLAELEEKTFCYRNFRDSQIPSSYTDN